MLASLFIPGRDWLLPAAGLFILGTILLAWAYRGLRVDPWVRLTCVTLKLLGLLALAACLLEPLWTGQRARPGSNYFALLADNSQGMQIRDLGSTRSRGEKLRDLLAPDRAPWQAKMEENFQVRRYLFDARLQAAKGFGELAFDGRASSIFSALRTLVGRYEGQPLAGVLLFTDGNATDLGEGAPDFSGLPPIYPVVIGTDDPVKDVAITKVTVTQTAFEDAPVTVQADVTAAGFSGEAIKAQLVELGAVTLPAQTNATNLARTVLTNDATSTANWEAKPAGEQTLRAGRDGEALAFRFQVRPARSGLVYYRLRIAPKEEFDAFDTPARSTEATLANNARVLVVDRGQGPYRILYVGGRPNWEFKFLNRAVSADDQVQLVGLFRIARREPKFEFRGRVGEANNPLFRGFTNTSPDEVERYDQPVLVRLNTKDEFELRGGFPKVPEDLYEYHAVIIDDLEAEFFTSDQKTLLQKFVSERGGGFLMLGGAESFAQGKYQRTPIGDMLPVYLDQTPDSVPPGEWKVTLTREGWLQPWARLRNNETDEKNRLEEVPPFQVFNRVPGVKPGASVIASATDAHGRTHPAVVVQRFGNGRTAAVMVGDLWRWGMRDEAKHKDLDKAWRQLMRWLVVDVPARTDMQVESKRGDPNGAVSLQVRVRDRKFQPLDNATATLTVHPFGASPASSREPGENPALRVNTEAALNEAGLYEATYVPRETGGYQAEVVVMDSNGAEVGRSQAGWTSDPAAEEFRSLRPNRSLLEAMAKRTGGEILTADKLDDFVRTLPERKAPIQESWSLPLWHNASVFLFALACFAAEWGLRRWKGLA